MAKNVLPFYAWFMKFEYTLRIYDKLQGQKSGSLLK